MIKRLLCILFAVVAIFSTVSVIANASSETLVVNGERESATTAANRHQVYSFLVGEMGLPVEAACGALGNIWAESRFYPTETYGVYHGLCQWGTGSGNGNRWSTGEQGHLGCQAYCNQNGLDYNSVYGQCRFIQYEWNTVKQFKSHINELYGCSAGSDGVYAVESLWRRIYEGCGNQAVSKRQGAAMVYYNYYKGNSTIGSYAESVQTTVKQKLKVSFSGIGLNLPASIRFTQNLKVPNETPKRVGYTFLGWKVKDSKIKDLLQPGETWGPFSKDTELEAQWEKIQPVGHVQWLKATTMEKKLAGSSAKITESQWNLQKLWNQVLQIFRSCFAIAIV